MVKKQSQPKYRIVEDYLRARISSGEFPVDSLLPTEENLCARFGVSRATVRTALSNIQADGLIVRSAAIGSRVVNAVRNQSFQAGWSSVEDLLQYTKSIRLNIISIREIMVDADMADEVGFPVGRSLVRVEGIRWNQEETEEPICHVEVYFDALYNGVVDKIPDARRPIADLVEEQYQVRIEAIRQEVSARLLSPETAEMLQAKENGPSLLIKRWYFDHANNIFQMSRSEYPAERFRYVLDFGRSHD
ncbi:GntR family transcriptional regulator [Thalassospira marina]|uniref:HTH gntR-type domain-containing protein n=1 Tax=Thalassospira marina TaxID=2048283 RepID=A0A2N3KBU4_9PROT|nr:GntR family transcriptional regulator [Thalassospira marina]PKR48015.1 hypothetical protein COO20_25010 [Thalassospira marina]